MNAYTPEDIHGYFSHGCEIVATFEDGTESVVMVALTTEMAEKWAERMNQDLRLRYKKRRRDG